MSQFTEAAKTQPNTHEMHRETQSKRFLSKAYWEAWTVYAHRRLISDKPHRHKQSGHKWKPKSTQEETSCPNKTGRELRPQLKQKRHGNINELTEGENAEIEEFTTTPTHEAELYNPGPLKLRILE